MIKYTLPLLTLLAITPLASYTNDTPLLVKVGAVTGAATIGFLVWKVHTLQQQAEAKEKETLSLLSALAFQLGKEETFFFPTTRSQYPEQVNQQLKTISTTIPGTQFATNCSPAITKGIKILTESLSDENTYGFEHLEKCHLYGHFSTKAKDKNQ